MYQVRKLSVDDVDAFVTITSQAYTGLGYAPEDKERLQEWALDSINEYPHQDLVGVFKGDVLVGGMCLFKIRVNVRSSTITVGGIGTVAVDLLHKKEHAAKALISFALDYFRTEGVHMAALYPFEVGFYNKMGFGYGCELRKYRVKPAAFPSDGSKEHLQFFTGSQEEREGMLTCYNRYVDRTHGMSERLNVGFGDLFDASRHRVVGYVRDGEIRGYLAFGFEKEHVFKNHLVIREMIYDNDDALAAFCTFLNSQSDQFDRVVVSTQDEHFHHLFRHPHSGTYQAFDSVNIETSVTAVGMMYRIINLPSLLDSLATTDFGGQDCTITINVLDDFVLHHPQSVTAVFERGRVRVVEAGDSDTEVTLPVSSLSSLLMGAVDFKSLLRYGQAQISDEAYVNTVQRLFQTDQKPICTLRF